MNIEGEIMRTLILIILSVCWLLSCEHVHVEVGVDAPYTYELCETVIVTEYDIIERECVGVHSHHQSDYCVDLIDEFIYEYPELHCVVGTGYSYVGLELTHEHLYSYRDGAIDWDLH